MVSDWERILNVAAACDTSGDKRVFRESKLPARLAKKLRELRLADFVGRFFFDYAVRSYVMETCFVLVTHWSFRRGKHCYNRTYCGESENE